MNRRDFLKCMGALTLAWMVEPLNHSAQSVQAAMAHMSSSGVTPTSKQRLVVVFLRGAVDGLNVVIPSHDSLYYDARPTIAVPEPGRSSGALPLNQLFGLHPALRSLLPFWQQQQLAFIHACGSPNPSRSHFEAQDAMESGVSQYQSTVHGGWMNRLLHQLPQPHTSTQALNFGPTIPRIFNGSESVASINSSRKMRKPQWVDRPIVSQAFNQLYDGSDRLSQAYQEGRKARSVLSKAMQDEMTAANNGAPLPTGFVGTAAQLARLLKQDPHIQLAFIGLGGWDTHVNQGSSTGQLALRLKPVGEGLATLMTELGPDLRHTTIVVISEFGRTVKENGNKGTDHGHGNVMWLMGGGIKGGQVYGDWPGLNEAKRYEGRDLPVTTDFRTPLTQILKHHFNLNPQQLQQVFPGFVFPTNRPVPLWT